MGRQSVEFSNAELQIMSFVGFVKIIYCSGLSEQSNYEVLIVCSCNVSIKD